MSIQDDIFDIAAALEGLPESEDFDKLLAWAFELERSCYQLLEENEKLRSVITIASDAHERLTMPRLTRTKRRRPAGKVHYRRVGLFPVCGANRIDTLWSSDTLEDVTCRRCLSIMHKEEKPSGE